MTKNKEMWKSSGRNVHKFLMKESFRKLKSKGYIVTLESPIGKGIIDVLGIKGKKKVGVECVVRPTLLFVNRKIELYSKGLDELIFCYPSEYIPNFPIEDLVKVFIVNLPEYLSRTTFIKNNKLSKRSLEELRKIKKIYPDKNISIVTLSSEGQRRITVPKSDKTLKDKDLVEIIKIKIK